MTGPEQRGGFGPRERRWLFFFLVVATAYVSVLLTQTLLGFVSGFGQIILIVFLAWLLAFVMSPVARSIERRLSLSQAASVRLGSLLALIALGIALFTAGGAIRPELR